MMLIPGLELKEEPVPHISAIDSWQRSDAATVQLLTRVDVSIDPATVEAWSDDECKLADIWAQSAAISATDRRDLYVPARPDFIPLAPPTGRPDRQGDSGEAA